jgi:hypothetical protein
MESSRIEAIQTWPMPKTAHDIQVFLGFTGFYRRFIRKYAKISAPLTDLLRKETTPFTELPLRARIAFKTLVETFMAASMLRYFDPTLPIRVETDASAKAIGAVLSQLHPNGNWHPVAFRSRKMTSEETRYGTGDGELLAIVDAFKAWRHYVHYAAHPIQVITDHFNLKYLDTKQKPNSRQLRWLDDLAEINFTIHFRPGVQNPADGLSRRPDLLSTPLSGNDTTTLQKALAAKLPTLHALNEQEQVAFQDQQTEAVIRYMYATNVLRMQRRAGYAPLDTRTSAERLRSAFAGTAGRELLVPQPASIRTAAETAKPLDKSMISHIYDLQQNDEFVRSKTWRKRRSRGKYAGSCSWAQNEQDSLLRYKNAVYVPNDTATRQELLLQYHDHPIAGHWGVTKTLKLLRANYFWESQKRDVKNHVNTCPACQRSKPALHKPYGELGALPTPTRPGQELSMDFITGLPESIRPQSGKPCNAILVLVDRFTKYSHYIATTAKLTAAGLAEILFRDIFALYGVPDGIVSDRGSLFTSNFWQSFCYLLKIQRKLSTAYHPQTDGQTERQNQVLEHYLRTYCDTEQSDWASNLTLAQFAYNNAWHSTIDTTPAEALMGYKPVAPGDAPLPARPIRKPRDNAAAKLRVNEMVAKRTQLVQTLDHARTLYEKHYNKKRHPVQFQVNQWVKVSTKHINQRRPSRKLSDKWIGPFRVTKVLDSKLAYELDLRPPYNKIHNVLPVSLLEPWHTRDDPKTDLRKDIDIEAEKLWMIERIVSHRGRGKQRQYLIKWEGFPDEENTWEPRRHLDAELARQYDEDQLPKRRRIDHDST